MAYTVGGIVFSSKAKIKEHVRSIINPKSVGDRLVGEEKAFMVSFFEQFHPKWNEKRGSGGRYLEVERNAYGNKGFKIVRVDGTDDDLSWTDWLNGKTPTAHVKSVLRHEVADQIFAAKDAAFALGPTIMCLVARIPFKRYEAEVDHHEPTFAALVAGWVVESGVDIATLAITNMRGGMDMLTVRGEASSWQEYHRRYARLRVLSKIGHKMVTHK